VAESFRVAVREKVDARDQGIDADGELIALGDPQEGTIIADAYGHVRPPATDAGEVIPNQIEFGHCSTDNTEIIFLPQMNANRVVVKFQAVDEPPTRSESPLLLPSLVSGFQHSLPE